MGTKKFTAKRIMSINHLDWDKKLHLGKVVIFRKWVSALNDPTCKDVITQECKDFKECDAPVFIGSSLS